MVSVINKTTAKVPITIGMIGHRDLIDEDYDLIKSGIKKTINEIQQQFPNTPLMCVTSLAEGADQLAFDTSTEEGLQTLVISPMPYDDYLEDFSVNPDSFENRWDRADHKFEIPWLSEQENRNTQYDAAAFTIASNVHFLIVLWDGKDIGLQGGTSETVNFRKSPSLPDDQVLKKWLNFSDDILKSPETGPLIHINVRRNSEPKQNIEVGKSDWFIPEQLMSDKNSFFEILKDHDRLNRDIQKSSFKLDEYSQLMKQKDLKDHSSLLVNHFSIFDSLAVKFSKMRKFFLILTILLSWSVLFSYELYGNAPRDLLSIFMSFYLLSIIFAWGAFTLISRCHWQDRFFDYRSYAEALRVQFFWMRYGIKLNVADYAIQEQTTDLAWIRFGLRTSYLLAMADQSIPIDKDEVKERWIKNQKTYFEQSKSRDVIKMQRYKRPIPYLLGGAVIFILAHYFEATIIHHLSETALLGLLNISVLLPTIAVILGFVVEVEGYEEHVNEYEKMNALYNKAERHLKELPEEKHKAVILELGKKALAENGYWLSLHRTKHVQIVT